MWTSTDSAPEDGGGAQLDSPRTVRLVRGALTGRTRAYDTARVERAAHVLLPSADVLVEPPSASKATIGHAYLPFPTLASCRLLVPLDTHAAAAAALRLRTPPGPVRLRSLAYGAAALSLRTGLLQRLVRTRVELPARVGDAHESLADHIAKVLGRPVALGVRVGVPDPHRTMGMHVLGLDGELLAFVKVATAELPAAQLRTEARALQALGASALAVPRLLELSQWNGLQVIVTTPLDLIGAKQPPAERSPGAAVLEEVARSGRRVDEPLVGSSYWAATHRRISALAAAPGVPRERLRLARDLLAGVASTCGTAPLRFGAWHGDWLPWNIALRSGRLLAWDWEYWDDCVPVGFDELHYHFGTCFFRAQASLPDSYAAMRTRAESVLSELGLEARERELVVALYLVEFLLRRLEIAAAGGGADDGRVFPDLFVVGFDALARVSAAASAV